MNELFLFSNLFNGSLINVLLKKWLYLNNRFQLNRKILSFVQPLKTQNGSELIPKSISSLRLRLVGHQLSNDYYIIIKKIILFYKKKIKNIIINIFI